jgi:hypothetical protein
MKKFTLVKNKTINAFFYILLAAGMGGLVNSCSKSSDTPVAKLNATTVQAVKPAAAVQQSNSFIQTVTVANIRKGDDGSAKVTFCPLEEIFTVQDAAILASLQDAFSGNRAIQITFDPWQAAVLQVKDVNPSANTGSRLAGTTGTSFKINLATMTNEAVDNVPASAVINTTTTGLTNVVPDMATAQLMFDYITHQSCSLGGPFGIDQCISFQYCQDGCYARAHKMCWIINNKYHYETHKIFSFANAGKDELCVQAQKWGGCCVNWWYHVAPLVNVKTPSGTKAYVFDAAMFDQPVLLSVWLHAQENPACIPPASGDVPHVSMINIQPTSSYWPHDGTGLTFDTDPTYSSTNSTMATYSPRKTCP